MLAASGDRVEGFVVRAMPLLQESTKILPALPLGVLCKVDGQARGVPETQKSFGIAHAP
jgi:hypothetical protein